MVVISQIVGAAGLAALVLVVGWVVAKFANAFSSFEKNSDVNRPITERDHLGRPTKWGKTVKVAAREEWEAKYK
jgi:hypothetical protein